MTGRGDMSFRILELQLQNASSIEQRDALITEFLQRTHYPILEDDTSALLLYRGEARSVSLIGDMTDWIDQIPFEGIPGTDLWCCRLTCEPDARLEYLIQVDGEPATADAFNPDTVHGFVWNSELAMPQYHRRPVFDAYRHGQLGGFELLSESLLPAGVLPYSHGIHVYLPPGYATSSHSYPVIYFQDGRDYIEYGVAAEVIHWQITRGFIQPLIAVFVTPPNLHVPAEPNRITEYGMNESYVSCFCNEVVPWVDTSFRTVRSPEGRLVIGDSYGGLISLYIAWKRPDLFGCAYSQSGYLSFQSDRLLHQIASGPRLRSRLFVDIGTYERRVAHGIVPDQEGDFLAANRRFRDLARQMKLDLEYREYHEGHTWGNWRAHLHDALRYFFGTAETRNRENEPQCI